MKNKFSKLILFYISIIVLSIFPFSAFTQEMPISHSVYDLKGFNRSVFDSHFNRADRELNPESWLAEAKWGITQALCAWELYASVLFDSSFKFEEAKIQIENWCDEELEVRFSKWLIGRFFGELAEKSISDLHAVLAVTDEEISEESYDWRFEKKDYIITGGNAVTDNLHYLYVELLDYLPGETRESMNAIILDSVTKTNFLLKSEFENIAARQERIFTRRRLPDYLSAEYKTYLAKQTARHLADQMVIETEEFCAQGINEIRVKIEQASAGTGDLVLLGEEWLQLYKEQFERGLKAWQEAEERFFMRRIEWEQETFKIYSEGEDVWYEAFVVFENKRSEWEMLIKRLLEEGEEHFKNISENFERNIAEAKAEFELNAAIRIGTVSAKIKALSDIYIMCVSAADSMRENILFKEKKLYGIYNKDPQDKDYSNWLSEQRENLWQSTLNSYSRNTSLQSDLDKLIILQTNIENEENEKVKIEAEIDRLAKIEKKTEEDKKDEEEAKANLRTSLKEIENAEKTYNDQLEFLHANYEPYYKIPQMINGEFSVEEELQYFKEIENLRILNTQDYLRYLDLHDSYELYISYITKAIEARDTIISDFGEIFGDFALKNILLQDMSSEDFCLDEYQLALIRANTLVQYWERKTHIAEIITQLSIDYENGLVSDDEIYDVWRDAKTAYEESITLYNSEMEKLNNISGDIFLQQQILNNLSQTIKIEEDKLAKLNSQYSMLIMAGITGQNSYFRKDLNSNYILLIGEYEKLFKTDDNASYKSLLDYGIKYSLAEQLNAAENVLNVLINGNEADIKPLSELYKNKDNNKIEIMLREAAIDMFVDSDTNEIRGQNSSYSSTDWYLKVKGINNVNFNLDFLYGENLGLQLSNDLYKATKKIYEKRLELELAALQEYFKEFSEEDTDDKDINEYEMYMEIYSTLLDLQKLIKNDDFNNIDSENEIIHWFFSDGTFLSSLNEENLSALYNEYWYCQGLLEIYSNYAAINSFTSKEIWQQSIIKLQKLFNDKGITFNNNKLPAADIICDEIIKKPGDLLNNTSAFLIEFNSCFSLLPTLLYNEIFYWQQSIIEYIAAYAFVNNINTSQISSSPEEEVIKESFIFILNSLKNEYSSTSNEKYWRQFLSVNYIEEYDNKIAYKSNLKSGLLTDMLEIADYHTNRLRDAFTLYSNGSIDLSSGNLGIFYYLYSNEITNTDQYLYNVNYLKNEISRIGNTFDHMNLPNNKSTTEAKGIFDALKKQEGIFNNLHDEYMSAAIIFEEYGRAYNEQYGLVKSIYDESNKNRYEYELQDSIIRYISTIYMDFDLFDYELCREKLSKAELVLKVLTDLYSGEDMRPYQNKEYNDLYSAYKESYSIKNLTMKAVKVVSDGIISVNEYYNSAYNNYINSLYNLGNVDQNYSDYISSADKSKWTIKDVITVKDGRLAFSLNENILTGIDSSKAKTLDGYFSTNITPSGEVNQLSQFQEALYGLSQRMSEYLSTPAKYQQWSLAREYLLLSLFSKNFNVKFLSAQLSGVGELKTGGGLGSLSVKSAPLISSTSLSSMISGTSIANEINFQAFFMWNNLSPEEKADLEFYVILTLSAGNNNYSNGFSLLAPMLAYSKAYSHINDINDDYDVVKYSPLLFLTPEAFIASADVNNMKKINNLALGKINKISTETKKRYDNWTYGLKNAFQGINSSAIYYQNAVISLNALNLKKEGNESISWGEIENALKITGKFTINELNTLNNSWKKMQSQINVKYSTLTGALTGFFYWAKSVEDENKIAFEKCWMKNDQQRSEYEETFNKLMKNYMDGNGSLIDLTTAANAAYGVNAAAWKTHFTNQQDLLFDNLFNQSNNSNSEINIITNELFLLSQKTMNARYSAELLAREIEWKQMQQELTNNYYEWQKIAVMLVERGRADWAAGKIKMEDAYINWTQQFKEEYNRINDEWANAYFISLLDKQQWVKSASEAAKQASNDQFLLYIGAEAERLSRLMDTREPLGFHIDIQIANDLLNEVLYYNGISNIYNAINVINNIANVSTPLIKRGLGGISMWDASLVKLNASDTIKQANKVIADNEAAKLAYNASDAASQIINSIYEYIGKANDDFRKSIDDYFLFNSFWTRSGNNYVKDVVIGSTLTKPVITETQTITGYNNYVAEQFYIKTRTDREYLQNLDSIAIVCLIENVYAEVEKIVNEIFGIGKESIKINGSKKMRKKVTTYVDDQWVTEYVTETIKLEEREQAAGKFGAHIGYQPAIRPSKYIGKTRETIFFDEGKGELGRLMSDYFYWSVIEGRGLAELTLPVWEKKIWDDTGYFFKSFTIRDTATMAAAIAAVVLAPYTGGASIGGFAAAAAISSSADFYFETIDAALGYKTWDEAIFNSAKTYVINFASTTISDGCGELTKLALGTTTDSASKIFIRTSMAGISSYSSTVVTGILSGINYDHENGWSYSGEAAGAVINGLVSNTLTSMTSAFVSSSLDMISMGGDGSKTFGYNKLNIKDIGIFNSLIGNLAGQSVNYALGNDFTLNLLNTGLLTEGEVTSGLLELHFSHDNSPTMKIGAGGANVSIDNLYHAVNGALVWNENIQNEIFKKREGVDISVAFRGVYGFGDKEAKQMVKNLRSGKEKFETRDSNELYAETTFDKNGNLKLVLGGYNNGMTPQEQLYLAVILQHEAYRDGFVEGDINSFGQTITFEDNFNEQKTASIARIEMAQRIDAEYKWFLNANDNLQFEQGLLNYAKKTGDYLLYDTYLQTVYNNDKDYYLLKVSTNGDYQSNYRGIPLINSEEETRKKNEKRLQIGFQRYKSNQLYNLKTYESEETLWNNYISDTNIQKKYGGNPLDVETISLLGCMFMSVKYGTETLTGEKIDTMWFNNYIRENGLFAGDSNLTNLLMARIMTNLTDNNVSLVEYGTKLLSVETLYDLAQSEDMYLAHLRIKTGGTWDHSVMLSGIEFIHDDNGNVTGISAVEVANPSTNTAKITGRSSYTLDQISRWDIFKVTPKMPTPITLP